MKKVAIPQKMQKFYGTGIMLHPDKEMVEAMVEGIPNGWVSTIDSLCDSLARANDTNVTCPMRTTNFVKTIIRTWADSNKSVPFWRVIRKNHYLINSPFTLICVERLKNEGFLVIQNDKGEFKVQNVNDRLFTFS